MLNLCAARTNVPGTLQIAAAGRQGFSCEQHIEMTRTVAADHSQRL